MANWLAARPDVRVESARERRLTSGECSSIFLFLAELEWLNKRTTTAAPHHQ